MVQIPQTYPTIPQPIATFDFEDIANNTGVVILFGISSETDGGVDYHLVPNKAFSSQSETNRTSSGTTTIDFDLGTFNLPRTAKGTAYFSANIGAATNIIVKVLVQLKHVTNSTETNITSEITSQSVTTGSGVSSEMVFLELPITEKHFKKGDFLRLTVKLNTNGTNGAVGHDPNNGDGTVVLGSADKITTVMELQMPFRIDI